MTGPTNPMSEGPVMSRLRNAPILVKLLAVAVLAVIGVLVIAVGRVSAIRPTELEARKTKTRNLVEAAQSVVAGYQKQAEAGKMSTPDAQKAALAALNGMRYDKVEYFWVNDLQPKMIMHPIKPQLNGQDLSTYKDPTGKLLFVEFVKTVRANGGAGYVSYLWPKPGKSKPVPKLSYVSEFAPWGWVIGTGIYIDDVDAIVAAKRKQVITQTIVVLTLLVLALVAVSLSVSRPLARLTTALRRLADGDTTVELPTGRHDEIGQMVEAVGVMRESLVAKDALERENTALSERAEQEKRRAAAEVTAQLDATVSAVLGRLTDTMASMQTVAADLGSTTRHLVESVHEISGRAGDSTEAAARAAQEAADVSGTVTGLTSAAETIGGVIAVIRKVAEQTNLLALNATIEAARAGELGKGFAVVAGEVKELAQQSAHATDEIAREVEAIQETSQEAAVVMARMADTVRTLGSSTHEVTSAISGSGGNGGVSVRQAAEATGEVARRIQSAADGMAAEAERLRGDFALLRERLAGAV